MHLRGGENNFVRDLILELARQGHSPALCAPLTGPISDELRANGVPVVKKPWDLGFEPDIIHGHSRTEVVRALRYFGTTPAVFVAHSHTQWQDRLGDHPRIRRYFGVSRVCLEPFRQEGVPESKIHWLGNFVDTRRFAPRAPLPRRPRRALVFSNYATAGTHLPAVTEACSRSGLPLDVIGEGVGNYVAQPEEVLRNYDLVFAKAKAAMEAMAVGAAVVLCDFSGVGPIVTSAEFEELRLVNFGFQALRERLTPENVLRQIERYDPRDATVVRDRLRACASVTTAVTNLVEIYEAVIREQRTSASQDARTPGSDEGARLWVARAAFLAYYKLFFNPPSQLTGLKRSVYLGGKFAFRLLRL
jgi:hypothetical protein